MKKIIALALILVMLFALSACGKEEAPAASEAPAAEAVQPEAAEPVAAPETTEETAEILPVETEPVLIEEDSGIYTFTNSTSGFSFDFDSKYVAMQNPLGNVSVFAGTDTGIPYCFVGLVNDSTAEAYLNNLIEGTGIELGDNIVTAAKAPAAVEFDGKEVLYIYYTYTSEDVEGNIACGCFAEDLENGSVAVYSYTAMEGLTADCEDIIKLAIETFKLN